MTSSHNLIGCNLAQDCIFMNIKDKLMIKMKKFLTSIVLGFLYKWCPPDVVLMLLVVFPWNMSVKSAQSVQTWDMAWGYKCEEKVLEASVRIWRGLQVLSCWQGSASDVTNDLKCRRKRSVFLPYLFWLEILYWPTSALAPLLIQYIYIVSVFSSLCLLVFVSKL